MYSGSLETAQMMFTSLSNPCGNQFHHVIDMQLLLTAILYKKSGIEKKSFNEKMDFCYLINNFLRIEAGNYKVKAAY
jgi:hypothetical protein